MAVRARTRSRGGKGGSVVAPFTPADIANLFLWLDASDTSTLWADTAGTTPATSTVARVDDKSGNAYNATQGTGANQPITGTRTINLLNCLDFDGSNDSFSLGAGVYTIDNGNSTRFIVVATDNTGAEQAVFNSQNGGSTRSSLRLNSTNLDGVNDPSFLNHSNYVRAADTNAHNVGFIQTSTSDLKVFEDGNLGSTTSAVNGTPNVFYIGQDNGGKWLNGRLGEVIFYNRALTDPERAQVDAYLSNKWGFP